MQIRFADDLLDASHLNYYGSLKYTDYLAAWMQEHIDIPDRRNDAAYEKWAQISELFRHRELNGRQLKEIETKDAYMEALKEQPDSVTAVCWENNGALNIYQAGACVFQATSDEDYVKYLNLAGSDLAIRCTDGNTAVIVDREQYHFTEDGLNILVYDRIAEQVIDGVGFDEKNEMAAVR
ncbi:hypothetical protein C823_006450 [Eubacterium plexicaudatum ASF492]|nr:hypothetical protein C823_006450 [Eubacterium plexicaudatum ASF492]